MHLLPAETVTLDETMAAVEPGLDPADILVLSFTDSDLAGVASAHAALPGVATLAAASLARLRHPMSVDLLLDEVARHARVIVVRLLGGADYWRYGVDELAALARARGIWLAIVPGDAIDDPRLSEASTASAQDLDLVARWFTHAGPANMGSLVGFLSAKAGGQGTWSAPQPLPALGRLEPACIARPGAPVALLLGYRSLVVAGDTAPFTALAAALARGGLAVQCLYVTSLKDPAVVAELGERLKADPPAIILNTTAFSARLDDGGSVLDRADAPVIQAVLSINRREAWETSSRGLSSACLAMNVVLPEVDGRIPGRAVAFKAETAGRGQAQYARVELMPDADAIDAVAAQAARWVRLRTLANAQKRLALVIPDYPGRMGRGGRAVGLDTAASVATIAKALAGEGYDIGPLPPATELMRLLEEARLPGPTLAAYEAAFAGLPDELRGSILEAWGPASALSDLVDGRFTFAAILAGNLLVALQPDRGIPGDHAASYHDPNLPPAHAYVAFHLWLRGMAGEVFPAAAPTGVPEPSQFTSPFVLNKDIPPDGRHPGLDPGSSQPLTPALETLGTSELDPGSEAGMTPVGGHAFSWRRPRHGHGPGLVGKARAEGIDALIHLGTHGTLEWLPGKSVALSPACAPAALIGDVPVIYPFIVNNPGEAAHARRRIGAVTLGHLTPPLVEAGSHGAAGELETLMDEYAGARSLDPRRAKLVAGAILARAIETGLADEAGISANMAEDDALVRLDAWLCDIKETRIGDGLHVYGCPAAGEARTAMLAALGDEAAARLDACGPSEIAALLAALSGRFVPPGPAGAPQSGRVDVLPTGRNLYAVDPRAVPTPTAWEIGRQLAAEVMVRHAQDHGDWPRSLVIDLWGSATMRTGGEDLAQAFAFLGVKPDWDPATARVTGFTVLPAARLERPRVDVTLRVSGLFRDVFADQIALFDRAVAEVASRDEAADINPLAEARRLSHGARLSRIFGAAPGAYGVGLATTIDRDDWGDRSELGGRYLVASGHDYSGGAEGAPAPEAFAEQVRKADAFLHVEDLPGRDVLDFAAFAEHEGGFAAAAAALGSAPALYHADTSRPGKQVVRTLGEDVARAVRARASNPVWIAGQMRHGHRGAAEIAETLDNLYALGVTAEVTETRQFDLLFDATLGDEVVRTFLVSENPRAAHGMAVTFVRAQARGLWQDRRNSTAAILAELTEGAA